MAPVMATRSMKVDVAVQSGLLGRMRGTVLADLVAELLTAAIHGAPGSRLLLTAAAHGDRVHVRVTDDLAGADPAVRAAGVRDLMQRVALRGGSLNIDVRPAEGTTLTLRFAGGW
jgi:signal transduction histidine kinase